MAGLLHSQGFGTRKECIRMVRDGEVEIARDGDHGLVWHAATDPEEILPTLGLHFKARGSALPYRKELFLALNKPAAMECSHTPSHYRSVFELFPAPFLTRGLQAVGRLDADTTGLLLLSDSGTFNHFFTSPRRHVPKTYRVGAKHAITQEQAGKLSSGVELKHGDGMTLPAKMTLLGERDCEITLEEGKYHQVKRMFAAAGNRVETIHRKAIGGLELDPALGPGQWKYLSDPELDLLGIRGG